MAIPASDETVEWLLAGDPAIRWQVMRDLLDCPREAWEPERAKVETEGWGARLLAYQDPDGLWSGGTFVPAGFTRRQWRLEGQPWTATCFVLNQLREFGLDPHSNSARRTVELIAANAKWEHAGEAFWEGEVEECINGRTLADGAYFGMSVQPIVDRLLADQQLDGGWNCERSNGSTCSSFASTINVLEGLLEVEKVDGPNSRVRQARQLGEQYLLRRHLYLGLRSGRPAHPEFLCFHHPSRWGYDVLRGLDYFRDVGLVEGTLPDPRLGDAIGTLRSKRQPDGKWLLERSLGGRIWLDVNDGIGRPSRWLTLRALRVLRWWDASEGDCATARSKARRDHNGSR